MMNGGWKHFMVLTFRVSERGSMHLLDLASERASDIVMRLPVTPPSCHPPLYGINRFIPLELMERNGPKASVPAVTLS